MNMQITNAARAIFPHSRAAMICATLLMTFCLVQANAGGPTTGDSAPSFKLQDQNGDWHQLSDYCGQWVALYFYPKDDTPGCTTEACEFRDEIYAFRKNNVQVLGISVDDVASHEEFAKKHSLPFSLLADSEKAAAKEYGVLKNYGVVKYSARETFLINPEGFIAKHYGKVEPEGHAADVLKTIKALSATAAE